nr:MAG TPA: hypothetical protein [Bacteriophage sp.]
MCDIVESLSGLLSFIDSNIYLPFILFPYPSSVLYLGNAYFILPSLSVVSNSEESFISTSHKSVLIFNSLRLK